MIHVAVHKDGQLEAIIHRVQFPGKDTGWLAVGEDDNVWLVVRGWGYWICHLNKLADDMADRSKKAARTYELRQIASGIMASDGSLDAAFENAAAGLRDGRAGYRILYVESPVGIEEPSLCREVAKACVRRTLKEGGGA